LIRQHLKLADQGDNWGIVEMLLAFGSVVIAITLGVPDQRISHGRLVFG
jgi:hypothetical protein